MSVAELLSELRARGLTLVADGDRLKSVGERGSLTPELAERIRHHKVELLGLLNKSVGASAAQRASRGVPKTENQTKFPLSVTQARVVASGRERDLIPTAHRISGDLKEALLVDALNDVVKRHPLLRAVFELDGDFPHQRIEESREVVLDRIDLSAAEDKSHELHKQLIALAAESLDPSRFGSFRPVLVILSPEERVLFVGMSPLVFDGRSIDLFWRDLVRSYASLSAGHREAQPTDAASYADFVAWQRRYLEDEGPRLAEFWRKKLGLVAPPAPAPTDHPRRTADPKLGASVPLELDGVFLDGLRRFSEFGVTTQQVLFAALSAWLARAFDAPRVLIASPIEARLHSEFSEVIGPFVNVVLLPTKVDLETSFDALVRRSAEEAFEAYEHQAYPIESLTVRSSEAGQGMPTFQVEFSFQTLEREVPAQGAVGFSAVHIDATHVGSEISIVLKDEGPRIVGAFEYRAGLFDRDTVRHWVSSFLVFLESVLLDPSQSVSAVDLLGREQERVDERGRLAALSLRGDPRFSGIERVRVVDARGKPVPLGSWGLLEVERAAVWRHTGFRARLRSDGVVDEAPSKTDRAPRRPYVAPVTDLEKRVVGWFSELLDIEFVGVDDDFFDLGGNSLVALQLFLRIRQECGIRLPQVSIVRFATPRLLAAAISGAASRHRDGSLVLLRGGTTRQTIYFVHDGDGETLLYLNLARRLPSELSVFGIQPLSRGSVAMVHTSVEEAAVHYASEIQRAQPTGPYRLAGLCTGGILAFAVAAELEKRGETVAFLGLAEAVAPGAEERTSVTRRRLATAVQTVRRALAGNVAQALVAGVAGARGALRHEAHEFWRRLRSGVAIEVIRSWGAAESITRAFGELSVRDVWAVAERSYVPPVLHRTRAVLIRATKGDGTEDDRPFREVLVDDRYGWGHASKVPLVIVDVDGGRSTMWREPYAGEFARRILSFLALDGNHSPKTAAGDSLAAD